jgi:hypothetical protein
MRRFGRDYGVRLHKHNPRDVNEAPRHEKGGRLPRPPQIVFAIKSSLKLRHDRAAGRLNCGPHHVGLQAATQGGGHDSSAAVDVVPLRDCVEQAA